MTTWTTKDIPSQAGAGTDGILAGRAAAYYGPDGFSEMKGAPARAKIMPQAVDAEVSARLWEQSIALTSVRWETSPGLALNPS